VTEHYLVVDPKKEKIGSITSSMLSLLQGTLGPKQIAGKSLSLSSSLGRKLSCQLPVHAGEFQGKLMPALSRLIC
jgi:hypothetical protein